MILTRRNGSLRRVAMKKNVKNVKNTDENENFMQIFNTQVFLNYVDCFLKFKSNDIILKY